jgi:hypothetical protein
VAQYRLSNPELLEAFDHHNGGGLISSLKAEIVLLRALLEDRLNLAETPAERMSAFPVITNALATLAKMVDTLQKVEIQAGRLLSLEQVEKFTDAVVAAVAAELPNNPELVDRIVDRIEKIES